MNILNKNSQINTVNALIYVLSCAVNQQKVDNSLISSVDRIELFNLAVFHQVNVIVAFALKKVDEKDDHLYQETVYSAISNTVNYNKERQVILDRFEEAQIWYMPLKGVILKDYYPQIGMRQMSDNDILFDASRAEDVRQIMTSLGYTTDIFDSGHRDDYRKSPAIHFEMHRVLFDETVQPDAFLKYYKNIKSCMIKDEDNEFGYHLSNEDFYIYMIAHEYKHYSWGGTGIRSLLDVYVYIEKMRDKLNWTYIRTECEKLAISDFEEKNRALAEKLFSMGNHQVLNAEEEKMLNYYIQSGTYGIWEHSIQNQIDKYGKFRYVIRRVFPPMEAVKETFPFFYKHKILLPFLPIYRIMRNKNNASREIKYLIRNHK